MRDPNKIEFIIRGIIEGHFDFEFAKEHINEVIKYTSFRFFVIGFAFGSIVQKGKIHDTT